MTTWRRHRRVPIGWDTAAAEPRGVRSSGDRGRTGSFQFITLYITPVIYLYLEDFQEKVLDRVAFCPLSPASRAAGVTAEPAHRMTASSGPERARPRLAVLLLAAYPELAGETSVGVSSGTVRSAAGLPHEVGFQVDLRAPGNWGPVRPSWECWRATASIDEPKLDR